MALKDNALKVKDVGLKAYGKFYDFMGDESNIDKIVDKLTGTLKKIPAGKGEDLANTIGDYSIYVYLLRDFMYKNYTEVPKWKIVVMILGYAYVVSPLDLIPDTITGVGMVDDAAIMKLVKKLFEDEIDAYKDWRKAQGKGKIED